MVSTPALAQDSVPNIELDIFVGEDNNNIFTNESQFLSVNQDQAISEINQNNNNNNANKFYENNIEKQSDAILLQRVESGGDFEKPKRLLLAASSYESSVRGRVPRRFWTWNVDGLTPRVASGLEEFCKQARLILPDVISLQEPRLECCSNRGRTFASLRCSKVLDYLCSRLPRYKFYCSFASKKYAGQILAVFEECSLPSVRYNLEPEAEEFDNKHDEEGRIIVAEFHDLRIISVYVPHNSMSNAERVKRRCQFDDKFRVFLSNQYRVSSKPIVLLGDLNSVHEDEDFYVPSHFVAPVAEDLSSVDVGFPGTTESERKRFRLLLSEARLIDYGLYATSTGVDRWTWQGRGKFKEFHSRLDYVLVSEILQQRGCIEKYSVGNYYDSDHKVVELILVQDWSLRLKGGHNISNAIARISLRSLKNASTYSSKREYNLSALCSHLNSESGKRNSRHSSMPLSAQRALADRHGHLLLDSDLELPCNALLDTGCSNANYMSSKFYNENLALLEPYSSATYGSVYFADRKQKQNFDTRVTAPLRFFHI